MIPLSDAIAIGRVLLMPMAGSRYRDGSGCAMGMALSSVGVPDSQINNCRVSDIWPWVNELRLTQPCACPGEYGINCIVVHLFDVHVMNRKDWSLDRLIDWVRSIEPAEAVLGLEAMPVSESTMNLTQR